MTALARQAVLLVSVLTGTVMGQGSARELGAGCDALLESAVKRAYGWAWESQASPVSSASRHPTVSFEPRDTPAAGMVLLWAGQVLREPRYTQAALEAARAIAASQERTGKIPSQRVFGPAPGGRETGRLVSDRSSTIAGLALLVAVIGADPARDEQFNRAARRAAAWLVRQQARDGGWPSLDSFAADGTSPPRIILLDNPDYRNSTLALLLADSALEDRASGRAAARSLAKLLSLRLTAPARLRGMWSTAYQLNGGFFETHADLPPAADTLATRFALQTLLAAYVMNRDAEAMAALSATSITLRALQSDSESRDWQRRYPLQSRSTLAPPKPDEPQSVLVPSAAQTPEHGEFGLPVLLDKVSELERVGADEFEAKLREHSTPTEQIALVLVCLRDQVLTSDWPESVEQAEVFLRRERSMPAVDEPGAEGLSHRTARLYSLLVAAELEARFPGLSR